jgi:hypothetical protein
LIPTVIVCYDSNHNSYSRRLYSYGCGNENNDNDYHYFYNLIKNKKYKPYFDEQGDLFLGGEHLFMECDLYLEFKKITAHIEEYYLVSSDNLLDVLEDETKIDISKLDNLFKVIKVYKCYLVVDIIKNNGIISSSPFTLGDIIHMGGGMLEFYSVNEKNKIQKASITPTKIINKFNIKKNKKLTFYNSDVEDKIENLLDAINENSMDIEKYTKIKNFIINSL